MRQVLKRLFCTHYFVEDHLVAGWPDPKVQYHCVDCCKVTIRRPSNAPVNPLRETNQEYYDRMVAAGQAAYVMRPVFGTENKPRVGAKESI